LLIDYAHDCYYQFKIQETKSLKPEYFHLSSKEGTHRVAHYSVLIDAKKKRLQYTLKDFEKKIDHISPLQFIDFWHELLLSLTEYMKHDVYVQMLTPLLSRILYQWYERLNRL
jgi:hypothetical protein